MIDFPHLSTEKYALLILDTHSGDTSRLIQKLVSEVSMLLFLDFPLKNIYILSDIPKEKHLQLLELTNLIINKSKVNYKFCRERNFYQQYLEIVKTIAILSHTHSTLYISGIYDSSRFAFGGNEVGPEMIYKPLSILASNFTVLLKKLNVEKAYFKTFCKVFVLSRDILLSSEVRKFILESSYNVSVKNFLLNNSLFSERNSRQLTEFQLLEFIPQDRATDDFIISKPVSWWKVLLFILASVLIILVIIYILYKMYPTTTVKKEFGTQPYKSYKFTQ